MLFLKRLETFGFKSFADTTVINFEYEMTGVVGPNGSGKSNINDAIRWTLGEQSIKSLRGVNNDDVIFNGSENKSALNMAEVKLIFDNATRIFDIDYDEVQITRRVFRGSGENEYFINNTKVRLKDIQDLALDTGLTKSSLAIISQGNVSAFAEAKPQDRRVLFEEAAGVAKYKKRKLESIRKLEKTSENLNRLRDIVNEIQRKLPSLKRQSEKAQIYNEKKTKLNAIELSILVKDITFYNEKLQELKENKRVLTDQKNDIDREIIDKENEYNQISKQNYELDKSINALNKEFTSIVNTIGNLKIQKIEFDNKKNALKMSDSDITVKKILSEYQNGKYELELETNKLVSLRKSKAEIIVTREQLILQQGQLNEQLGSLSRSIIRLENDCENLQSKLENKDNLFEGVRNIINNKTVLPGVVGIVKDLLQVDARFETAVLVALASRLQDVVVEKSADAKHIINFLKENRAGQATLIPLDTITSRFIKDDEQFVMKSVKGYIDVAHKLITINPKYQVVVDYLLARVIFAENIDSAFDIAKLSYYKYNIITLDGTQVRPQGAVTGGSRGKRQTAFNPERDLNKLKEQLTFKVQEEKQLKDNLHQIKIKIDELSETLSENQSSIGSTKRQIEILTKDVEKLKDEYQLLTSSSIDQNAVEDNEQYLDINERLQKSTILRDQLQQQLTVNQNLKEKQVEQQNSLNNLIQEKRYYLSALLEQINKTEVSSVRLEEKLAQDLHWLTQEYNMTFERASEQELPEITDEEKVREEIKVLRVELQNLGNVNQDAILEYQQENELYHFFNAQSDELIEASKNLTKAINEIDQIMETQFDNMIKDVNKFLPDTFKILFGGGTAKIIYTEADNILETGVDIKIAPPGKTISNLNLLSGGEKSLVALSVLFAILKARPIPLVILDEAEAPLDPANVERFAKYIKSFIETTQFIIVTHRIGTMENCDVLYGTTMQKKGITKIVGIQLLQAKQLVEKMNNNDNVNLQSAL